jgi:HAE1 family hydrophobic/amphiphilic exporter-1
MSFIRRSALLSIILLSMICGSNLKLRAQTPTPTPPPPQQITSGAVDAQNTKRIGIDSSETLTLTLDDAIRQALENNNSIEIAREDVKYSETRLRSLLGVYDPVFQITPNYNRTSQNGSKPTNNFSVDLGWSQLLKSGARFEPFFNNSRSGSFFTTTANGTTTQTTSSSAAFYRSSAGVSFSQPLLRNRSIDATRRSIRIQRKSLQQTDADFRRITIDVIARVQRAYWDLVFALRDQQNRLVNLNLTRESLRQVEVKIAAGSAAPLQRAEIAAELANREFELLVRTEQVAVADNALKQLIFKESNSTDWRKSIVPTDKPNIDMSPLNLDDAMADARANRPELQRLKLQSEINTIDIDYFGNQTKPQVDLVSSFSLNGYAQNFGSASAATTSPLLTSASDLYLLNAINSIRPAGIPEITNTSITLTNTSSNGSFGSSLKNLFSSNSPSYSIGFTIGFPLRNRTAKADLAGAKIQQQQIEAQTRSQEQTIIVEVRNAVQAVESSRLRVLAARRARENAEIQLQGEQKLYEVGRSTTFLLFERENQLANSRNAEIRAETDYNKAISDLQKATSTTFRANNIEVESPMDNK